MARTNHTGDGTHSSIRNVPPFTLRIEEPLRRQLEAAAERNEQSLQKELIARLERSFLHEACDQAIYSVKTTHAHRYMRE